MPAAIAAAAASFIAILPAAPCQPYCDDRPGACCCSSYHVSVGRKGAERPVKLGGESRAAKPMSSGAASWLFAHM